jgi:hypothetical protein
LPQKAGKVQWRLVLRPGRSLGPLAITAGIGIYFGLTSGLAAALAAVFVFVLFGIALMIVAWQDYQGVGPLSPRTSWRDDLKHGLMAGVIFGLPLGLGCALVTKLWFAFTLSLTGKIAFGLGVAFAFGLGAALHYSRTWIASLAFLQLANRWQTPVRLMRFLDDARERNVLRTVGPVYQFRHALLQDRLAGPDQRLTLTAGGDHETHSLSEQR